MAQVDQQAPTGRERSSSTSNVENKHVPRLPAKDGSKGFQLSKASRGRGKWFESGVGRAVKLGIQRVKINSIGSDPNKHTSDNIKSKLLVEDAPAPSSIAQQHSSGGGGFDFGAFAAQVQASSSSSNNISNHAPGVLQAAADPVSFIGLPGGVPALRTVPQEKSIMDLLQPPVENQPNQGQGEANAFAQLMSAMGNTLSLGEMPALPQNAMREEDALLGKQESISSSASSTHAVHHSRHLDDREQQEIQQPVEEPSHGQKELELHNELPQQVPDIMPFTSLYNVVKPSDSEDDETDSDSDTYDSPSDSEDRASLGGAGAGAGVGTFVAAGAVDQLQVSTQMPTAQVQREASTHALQQQQQQEGFTTASSNNIASASASVSAPISGQTIRSIAKGLEKMKAIQNAFQTNASQWEVVLSNLAKLNRLYHENAGSMPPDMVTGISRWSDQVKGKLAGETSAMEREIERLEGSIKINNDLIKASQFLLEMGGKGQGHSSSSDAPAPAPAPKVVEAEVNLPEDLDEEEILFNGF